MPWPSCGGIVSPNSLIARSLASDITWALPTSRSQIPLPPSPLLAVAAFIFLSSGREGGETDIGRDRETPVEVEEGAGDQGANSDDSEPRVGIIVGVPNVGGSHLTRSRDLSQ